MARGTRRGGQPYRPDDSPAQLVSPDLLPPIPQPAPRASPAARQLWARVVERLSIEMPRPSHQQWIAPLRAQDLRAGVLTVVAPSAFAQEYLEQRLAHLVERIASDVAHRPVLVRFVAAQTSVQKHSGDDIDSRPRTVGNGDGNGDGDGVLDHYHPPSPIPHESDSNARENSTSACPGPQICAGLATHVTRAELTSHLLRCWSVWDAEEMVAAHGFDTVMATALRIAGDRTVQRPGAVLRSRLLRLSPAESPDAGMRRPPAARHPSGHPTRRRTP